MKRKRKMSAAEKQRRRERRQARRRDRLSKMGPARRHWERRRRGQANSAPQLRNRPIGDGTGRLEDALLSGRDSVIFRALSVLAGDVARGSA